MISKNGLVTCGLLIVAQSGYAQQPPTSGGQIQQSIPPAPAQQRTEPIIRIDPGAAAPAPGSDTAKLLVNTVRVTGQTLYSEAQLIEVAGFRPATELTLTELRSMAQRISDYYHRAGYVVAQAYVPAQDIKDGAVTIAVLEGRYGNITLRNQSNLSDGLANGLLGGLNSGDPIAIGPLENRLLLLSDVPGINVRSSLAPGASVGASDLIVDVTPGARISGEVDADNGGNRYTGEYRLGATVNLNNPTGHGDVASLRVLTSGSGLNYARASYQMQIGKATAGVAYSALNYRLGKEFESLGAHGTAEVASIYGSYPLIRSRATNLYALLAFDAKTFQDKVDATSSVTDKEARVFTAGFYGNHRDDLGAGGVTSYSMTLSSGEIDIRTPAALAIDAATAKTNGNFGKLGFHVARLQAITDRFSLYGSLTGQFASKNLDVSEKMSLGGPYAVRAYPVGESYGDEGYVANLEARYLLSRFYDRMPGQMHLIGFLDGGAVTFNKNPWVAGNNHRSLSGAGVGLSWEERNNFAVRAYYAVKVGNEAATSAPDRNGRVWVQLVKYF